MRHCTVEFAVTTLFASLYEINSLITSASLIVAPFNHPLCGKRVRTFRIAESMGFEGEFRQWEHLLRVGE